MTKNLDKYTKKATSRSHHSRSTKMTIVDDDFVSAFSKEEITSFQGTTNVVGYGEKKMGTWDDDEAFDAVQENDGNKEVFQEEINPEQIVSDDSSEEALANIQEGESRFFEFQRQIEQSKKKLQDENSKKEYFREDPLILIRKKKLKETNQPQENRGSPNRFGIQPGLWWDGIDRSNGYERLRYRMINQAESKAQDNYKASIANM